MDALSRDYTTALAVCGLVALIALLSRDETQEPCPTVGAGSFPLAGHLAALRSITRFHSWVWEGYHWHKAGIFRVRLLGDWQYIVTGNNLIDELRRAPEDILSLTEATAHHIQGDYTLGDWRASIPIDLAIISTKLTRKLDEIMPVAVDEIGAAFQDEITSRLDGDAWATMALGDAIMRIVCRTSNRIFVGLPLCRNREYLDLCVQYAIDVFVSATIIRYVPAFLRPVVARYIIPITRTYARAERLMFDCISDRLRRTARGADDLPDDYLQWLIATGEPRLQSVPALAAHILRLNLVAIHSTTVTFTFALYQLAARPEEYQEPIRKEAEAVLAEHGWTREGLDRLHKLDSFLRETQRFHGIGAVSLDRKAMCDYTFANGAVIKRGQLVAAAARPMHRDAAIYPHAERFDGFRFYEPESGTIWAERSQASSMTSLSLDHLAFGSGRHACPGRFWAANELKAMMAHMVMNYDIRMEQDGVVPDESWMGGVLIQDKNARVLIRKRRLPDKWSSTS